MNRSVAGGQLGEDYPVRRALTRPAGAGVSCLFLTCGPLEELEEVQTMPPSPDVTVADAEARYHRERLALYKARVLSGKPTSPARLRELERNAAYARDRARLLRDR